MGERELADEAERGVYRHEGQRLEALEAHVDQALRRTLQLEHAERRRVLQAQLAGSLALVLHRHHRGRQRVSHGAAHGEHAGGRQRFCASASKTRASARCDECGGDGLASGPRTEELIRASREKRKRGEAGLVSRRHHRLRCGLVGRSDAIDRRCVDGSVCHPDVRRRRS